MPKKLSDAIKALALPAVILFLLSFGWGGKKWPTVNAMIEYVDAWLKENTDYPWIFAAGVTTLIMWGGYKLYCWYFFRRKEKWRKGLLKLLRRGVEIRNDGEKKITSTAEATQWETRADTWGNEVTEAIKKWDENLAEEYDLLDVSPEPRLEIKTDVKDHAWYYQHHDYRLVKLKELTVLMREPS